MNTIPRMYRSKISYMSAASTPGYPSKQPATSGYRYTRPNPHYRTPAPINFHGSMGASAFASTLYKTLGPSASQFYKSALTSYGLNKPIGPSAGPDAKPIGLSTGPSYTSIGRSSGPVSKSIGPIYKPIGPIFKPIGPSASPALGPSSGAYNIGPSASPIFKSTGPPIGPNYPSYGPSLVPQYLTPSKGPAYLTPGPYLEPARPSLGPYLEPARPSPTSLYKHPLVPSSMTPYHSSPGLDAAVPTPSLRKYSYNLYTPKHSSTINNQTNINPSPRPDLKTTTPSTKGKAHPTLKPEHIKQLPIIRRMQQSPNRHTHDY